MREARCEVEGVRREVIDAMRCDAMRWDGDGSAREARRWWESVLSTLQANNEQPAARDERSR